MCSGISGGRVTGLEFGYELRICIIGIYSAASLKIFVTYIDVSPGKFIIYVWKSSLLSLVTYTSTVGLNCFLLMLGSGS
jgi:hypothetical protein